MLKNTNNGVLTTIKSMWMNLSNTTLYIILAILLFSIVAFYYYYYYLLPNLKTKYVSNNELVNKEDMENNNPVDLMLFYVDWCPHCKTAKPVWDDLKSEYDNKTIKGRRVIFTEINCTEETAEVEKMIEKYDIKEYPTIKLLKDGQIIEYDAKPTKELILQFLNSVV
jgi:thiol-disulfide isomerase/thioredoxin